MKDETILKSADEFNETFRKYEEALALVEKYEEAQGIVRIEKNRYKKLLEIKKNYLCLKGDYNRLLEKLSHVNSTSKICQTLEIEGHRHTLDVACYVDIELCEDKLHVCAVNRRDKGLTFSYYLDRNCVSVFQPYDGLIRMLETAISEVMLKREMLLKGCIEDDSL